MSEHVDRFEHAGVTVTLYYEEDGLGNPRECDNLAHLYCWHPDYVLGDEQFVNGERRGETNARRVSGVWDRAVHAHDTQEEVYKFLRSERRATVILPLFLYDHSGITISAGPRIDKLTPEQVDARGRNPFDAAGWDTSWVGFAYTNEERRKYLGVKRSREEVEKQMRVEIEEYDKYLRGEVYGYVITGDYPEALDSCWGFLGHSYAVEEAKRAAEHAANDVLAKELNRLPVLTGA